MLDQTQFVTAPPGWTHADPNPFTADGSYGSAWSAFCLADEDNDQFFTGQNGSGPFSARFGRKVQHLEERLADFLRYENRHGRTVILSAPFDVDIAALVARSLACTLPESVVRPEDPAVLVHATTAAAWWSIQADGEIKAASQIEGKPHQERPLSEWNPVEEYLLHEPPEYKDYIMFGEASSYSPEMVVVSYAVGAFLWNPDSEFRPGLRLYLDNHRIIRDGLATRDGLHVMKVHHRLPLEPYLLAAVGVEQIDPQGKVARWTVRAFVVRANQFFYK